MMYVVGKYIVLANRSDICNTSLRLLVEDSHHFKVD